LTNQKSRRQLHAWVVVAAVAVDLVAIKRVVNVRNVLRLTVETKLPVSQS
jgi:hypothetical protein